MGFNGILIAFEETEIGFSTVNHPFWGTPIEFPPIFGGIIKLCIKALGTGEPLVGVSG